MKPLVAALVIAITASFAGSAARADDRDGYHRHHHHHQHCRTEWHHHHQVRVCR